MDIDAGNRAVALLTDAVSSTRTPNVLPAPGGFGGMYSLAGLDADHVLVASTDGVGTKAELAGRYRRWRGIGVDLVNHCIDDIAVHGARPLFFLDYVAMARLNPEVVAEIVAGMANACLEAGCALLGGETAEMPGVYLPGVVDVVGTIVGTARRDRLWPRPETVRAGDVLVGVASSGPHTNGYSLIRRLIEERPGATSDAGLLDALLEPHRSYLPTVAAFGGAGIEPKALAHITGGGIFDNLPRVLPENLGARIDLGTWPVPELFATLVDWGDLADAEAFRVWNMGIGLVVVVDEAGASGLLAQGHHAIGTVVDAVEVGGNDSGRVKLAGAWR